MFLHVCTLQFGLFIHELLVTISSLWRNILGLKLVESVLESLIVLLVHPEEVMLNCLAGIGS
jgi:hypothetical protein